jgi:DNA-binding CsgD family transcriptional regulator
MGDRMCTTELEFVRDHVPEMPQMHQMPITKNVPIGFLQTMVDAMDYGLIAIAAHSRRVLIANAEAERCLAEHPQLMRLELQGTERRLLVSPAAEEALRLQIQQALNGASRMVQIEGQGASKLNFSISPLAAYEQSEGPAVLLSFARASSKQRERVLDFAQSHRMTPTETEVLNSLLDGQSPKRIATKHFVAESTVRSQIRSIRQKTQCEGIRELLLQISRLPPARCGMPASLSAQ